MNKININNENDHQFVTLYEGTAPIVREPKIIDKTGNIDAPFRWLEKRSQFIVEANAHIVVNREELKIELVLEDKDFYGDTITGKADYHPAIKKFAINKPEYRTTQEMAHLFKMNRSYFENKSQAMDLVNELLNFRAKITSEIEKLDDKRGNKRELQDQTVNSNIPKNFNLCIPIFKGGEKKSFEVEIYIKSDDLTCCLISPQANDLIEDMSDAIIDKELTRISELCPGIAIIEK